MKPHLRPRYDCPPGTVYVMPDSEHHRTDVIYPARTRFGWRTARDLYHESLIMAEVLPARFVIDLCDQIRLHLGHGGANFPGAAELYAAAEKIEAWQRA